MTDAAVHRFEKLCLACERGLHDRCWWHVGQLLNVAPAIPCPCGCWDDLGLTEAALLDMMKRQPKALARKIRSDAGFAAHAHIC